MSNPIRLSLFCAIALMIAGASMFFGVVKINPLTIFKIPDNWYIFHAIRLPRMIFGFLSGGGLALCGLVYQALFRNPLACPFTLGIANGASFGAGCVIIFGLNGVLWGISSITIGALCGSMGALFLLFLFSRNRSGSGPAILLVGIIVGIIFSSALMFLHYFSSVQHSFQLVRWLMGGLEGVTMNELTMFLPLFLLGVTAILVKIELLDHFLCGEDMAMTRGVNIRFNKIWLIFATSIIVGAIVSFCGAIGFIGIIAPHICRSFFPLRHSYLSCASIFLGGALLVACDTLGRSVIVPIEIPVGIVTALVGGPFFLWVILKNRQLFWDYF